MLAQAPTTVAGNQNTGFFGWLFGEKNSSGSGDVKQTASDVVVDGGSSVETVAHQPINSEMMKSLHDAGDRAEGILSRSVVPKIEEPESSEVSQQTQQPSQETVTLAMKDLQQLLADVKLLKDAISPVHAGNQTSVPTTEPTTVPAAPITPVTPSGPGIASKVSTGVASLFSGVYAKRYTLLVQLSWALLLLNSAQKTFATVSTTENVETQGEAKAPEQSLLVAVAILLNAVALLSNPVYSVGQKVVSGVGSLVSGMGSLLTRKKAAPVVTTTSEQPKSEDKTTGTVTPEAGVDSVVPKTDTDKKDD